MGLRDIYISESETEFVFSTRVDWLVKAHRLKINFSEFGSRWLLFNQISNNSVFENVKRIIAGKKAVINLNDLKVRYCDSVWLPDEQSKNIDANSFSQKLKSLIFVDNKQTLGLSGGMDSRVILSFLLKERSNWDTFTFGNSEHPDSIIAQSLVKDFNLSHKQYNANLLLIDELISKIKEYSTQTIVNNAASGIFQSLNYFSMSSQYSILVDGGFGEIWRREFFYRLYFKEKKSILNKNIKSIVPYLSLSRADIFTEETNNLMLSGIEKQLQFWFETLPPVEKIGVENWIDLFALKTRLPNYYSHEQNRIDELVTSVMPFAQLSLLRNLFNVPILFRKNGKLFRNLIKNNFTLLEKYPLVKGNLTYPYYFNSLQSRFLSQVQKRINKNVYQDNSRDKLLNILKPYVFDISSSQAVKNSEIYNHKKVEEIINNYYEGDLNYGYALDWWLSFELFQQNFE